MIEQQVANINYPRWTMEIPLTQRFFEIANLYAQEQRRPKQAERVRLNTLAVLAGRSYLQRHQIETDVAAGDAWKPEVRSLEDVADLHLPRIGILECRPILPGQDSIELPMETWINRMGYLLVEIDEPNRIARLLGFAEPTLDLDDPQTTLSRNAVRSLDDLHEFIERRQRIQQLVDGAFKPIGQAIADDIDRAQLSTMFTWVSLTNQPRQWGRLGIDMFDRCRQDMLQTTAESKTKMMKDSNPTETEAIEDLVRELFSVLEDEFEA